eukprot:scaffold21362_cov34-Prasinocladus_malaysianus.AAC.1
MTCDGAGDFQIQRIEELADNPLAGRAPKSKDGDTDMATVGSDSLPEVIRAIASDPELRDPLERENVPNPLEGEQTWPTEEELREAEEATGSQGRSRRRLPKGTSAYQAAWILDDDAYDDGGEKDDDDDDDAGMGDGEEAGSDFEEVSAALHLTVFVSLWTYGWSTKGIPLLLRVIFLLFSHVGIIWWAGVYFKSVSQLLHTSNYDDVPYQ